MGKKENKVEHSVCEFAEELGFLVRKYKAIGVVGGPDRIFIGYDVVFWIEFKAPGETLDPAQVREIKRMRDKGAVVFVIDDIRLGQKLVGKMHYRAQLAQMGC